MKKQMFLIAAALVLGSVGHASAPAGDVVNDPNRASVSIHSPASDNFAAVKVEADCPFRAKKGGAAEQVADSTPAKANNSDLVR